MCIQIIFTSIHQKISQFPKTPCILDEFTHPPFMVKFSQQETRLLEYRGSPWPISANGRLWRKSMSKVKKPASHLPSSIILLDNHYGPFLFPSLFQLSYVALIFPPFPVGTYHYLGFSKFVPTLPSSPTPKSFLEQRGKLVQSVPTPILELIHDVHGSDEDSRSSECVLFCTDWQFSQKISNSLKVEHVLLKYYIFVSHNEIVEYKRYLSGLHLLCAESTITFV